ncbi:cell division protein ZapA [Parvibaculum sp.]|jgi:cell division protein ZapA|uniref:cell division protein ZapA n=1 Tax=Parvibaculum sp. TaxID=2024848 RepID=UPI003C7247F4
MGQVKVSINDRSYTIACGDGEEDHVRELAAYVSKHVTDLAEQVGQVGDARLLLMAGLMIADELSSAMQKTKMLEQELENLSSQRGSLMERTRDAENSLADVLDDASRRIEELARRIEAA